MHTGLLRGASRAHRLGAAFVGGVALLASAPALAESFVDLAPIVGLLPESEVYVDILDPSTEVIQFTGDQSATVYRPDGSLIGTFLPGSLINPDQLGAYRFSFATKSQWTLEVPGRSGGRVWSRDWRGEGFGFGIGNAYDFEAFAVVPGGAEDRWAVVRLVGEGTNAAVFRVTASRDGLFTSPGASTPDTGQAYAGQYRVYLEEPELYDSNPVDALVTDLISTPDSELCDVIAAGKVGATITFTASGDGVWRFVCDLDDDGTYEVVNGSEVARKGEAVGGVNTFTFDGRLPDGSRIVPGVYDCAVQLAIGEMHFVVNDWETIYPGLRMYETRSAGVNNPLRMFWDDTKVQANDVLLPSGGVSLVESTDAGVLSGPFNESGVTNTSARGWGRFTFNSKGNRAWMDTWTNVDVAISETITIDVVDGRLDADSDTLKDVEEDCFHGTDPTLPDTDGDGVGDAIEVGGPSDPLRPDTDGDGRGDASELLPDGSSPDADGDGIRDVRDNDDDNDGIPTSLENRDGANDDYDGDGKPNHLDLDADGDLFSDRAEGPGDVDNDGKPDFLDADTTGVGVTYGDGFYAGGCAQSVAGPAPVSLGAGLLGLLLLRRRRSRA